MHEEAIVDYVHRSSIVLLPKCDCPRLLPCGFPYTGASQQWNKSSAQARGKTTHSVVGEPSLPTSSMHCNLTFFFVFLHSLFTRSRILHGMVISRTLYIDPFLSCAFSCLFRFVPFPRIILTHVNPKQLCMFFFLSVPFLSVPSLSILSLSITFFHFISFPFHSTPFHSIPSISTLYPLFSAA